MKWLGQKKSKIKVVDLKVVEDSDEDKPEEEIAVLVAEKIEHHESRSEDPQVAELLNKKKVATNLEEDWGDGEALSLAWKMLFIVIGVILVGCLFLLMEMWTKKGAQGVNAELSAMTEPAIKKLDPVKVEKTALESLAQIEGCIKGYLNSSTIDEKIKYVRHPKRVRSLMQDYYSYHEMVPQSYVSILNLRPLILGDVKFKYVVVSTNKGKRRFLLEEFGYGEGYFVDWESDVCYMSMPWEEFIEKRPIEPQEMRVQAEIANVYLYQFADDQKYDCYRLTARDAEGFVYAYVEQASESGRIMRKMMRKIQIKRRSNIQTQSMTLRVRFPEKTPATNIVIVDELLAEGWTYLEPTQK